MLELPLGSLPFPPLGVVGDHVRVVAQALEDGPLQLDPLTRLLFYEVQDQVPLSSVPQSLLELGQAVEGLGCQTSYPAHPTFRGQPDGCLCGSTSGCSGLLSLTGEGLLPSPYRSLFRVVVPDFPPLPYSWY